MKLSELISRLANIMAKHGDLETFIPHDGDFAPSHRPTVVSMYWDDSRSRYRINKFYPEKGDEKHVVLTDL